MPTLLEVRFVSSNKYKIREAAAILEAVGVTVTSSTIKIEELQTKDTERLVRDKVLTQGNLGTVTSFSEPIW
ncbi:MAG: XTP/dITP diphosphohydrolase [Acidobacteriaceae bacterium]|nr:XTP/dITP diphosphohydrolase [Acidobacteriaceae bacterium]